MRQLPYQGTLWLTTFLQLLSLYEVRPWLDLSFASAVVPFCFFCFAVSAIIFSLFQGSSRSRALTSAQRGLLLISGIILAVQTILRYVGLRYTGPLQTILGEYAGAVIGSLFFKPLAKRIDKFSKSRIFFASVIVIYLLSQEWTATSCFPLLNSAPRIFAFPSGKSGKDLRDGKACGNLFPVAAATLAGFLSSLSKSVSAQPPLKSMSKKRHFFLNYAAAAIVLLPWTALLVIFQKESVVGFSMAWPLVTTVALGMMLAFFGDSFSVVSPSSAWHYIVSLCCLCVLDLLFNMDFSPLGSLLCSVLLGLGVRELTYAAKGVADNVSAEHTVSSSIGSLVTMVVTSSKDILSDTKSRKIAMFLLINTSYMIVEFTYGFIGNSLGLISDACHMLFDCAALAIGLYAAYISRLQANAKFNYGYGRFEVLSGYANAVFLVLVAALIVLESLERILDPPEISTESLLLVSVGGLVVNIIGLLFFHEAHHHAHGGSCVHAHSHEHKTSASIVDSKVMVLERRAQQRQTPAETVCCPGDVHQHDHLQPACGNGHLQDRHSQGPCGNTFDSEEAENHRGKDICCNGHKHRGASLETDERHCSDHLFPARLHGETIEHRHNCHISDSDEHVHEQHDYGLKSQGVPQDGQEGHAQYEMIYSKPAQDHHEHLHQRFHDSSVAKDDVEHVDELSNREHNQSSESHIGAHSHSEHEHDCEHHEHHHRNSLQPCTDHGIDKCSHSHLEQHIQVESHEQHGHDHHDHHHNHLHQSAHHHHDAQSDLNMEGIFLHVLADTLGSVGVVLSTLLLKYKGWVLADAACSIFISALIIATVIPLLRSSSDILLLRVPRSAEKRISTALEELKELPGFHDCHRIHIWSLTNKEVVGSLHVHAEPGADKHMLHNEVLQLLLASGVTDLTVQIEELQGL